jgi:GNAT superfamily N-acetyltransferase
MQPEITPLDPADEQTVAAVQALRVAARATDIPDFPPPCPVEFRADLTHETSSHRTERYVARVGTQVAGFLSLGLPRRDNLDNAHGGVVVHPEHRRRGIGRAMYAYACQRVRDLGRKRLATASVEQVPGGPPRTGAGRGFGTAVGAKAVLDEVRRRLDLSTADEAAMSMMLADAQARSAGYELVTWRGRTPDAYVADAAYLDGRLFADAPVGDLTLEPELVDTARIREREVLQEAGGMTVYSAGAVDTGSGRLVALTALGRMATVPWHAWQWITLVDPDHRGHRLGALVKIGNLRFARDHEPALRAIDTWNAAVNSHMISINEEMGFRPVDALVNWEQEV